MSSGAKYRIKKKQKRELETREAAEPAHARGETPSTTADDHNTSPPPPPPPTSAAALADAGGPSDEQRLQRGLQRNQQRNRCGGRVPAGWLESPCGGANIFGIAPVKTPLSSVFDLPSGAESWTPAECVDKCGGAAAVAVVIDLTATRRYYSPSDLPEGVRHLKLPLAGRATPTDDEMALVMREFVAAAAEQRVYDMVDVLRAGELA